MEKNNLEKKRADCAAELALCAVTAFVLMAVCTRSSFLYPLNNWDDVNSYFTVGKSIFRGRVPYRDLFDQKGFLLYLLYGIASLFSYTGFAGVFVFEVLSSMMTLLAVIRIGSLYASRRAACLFMPLAGAAMYSCRAMWWGGSAEEFMLPFLMWGLYLSMHYFRDVYPEPVPYRTLVTGGVCASFVFLIKFNSLGFYFAWMMMFVLADLFGHRAVIGGLRRIQLTMYGICAFVAGFLIPLLPVVFYFMAVDSVYDWLYVYLYCNLFVYSVRMTLAQRFYGMFKTVYYHIGHNPLFFTLLIVGGLYFLLRKDVRWIAKINLLALGFFLMLGIFIGGVDLPYYPLPLSVFSALAVPLAGNLFDRIPRFRGGGHRVGVGLLCACSLLLSAGICLFFTENRAYLGQAKEDQWQYRFRDVIAAEGEAHPTLINIGGFDAGLYTVTGIVPHCYYFQTQTINLGDGEVRRTQMSFVREGNADWLLLIGEGLTPPDAPYEQVAEAVQQLGDYQREYYLYRKVQ